MATLGSRDDPWMPRELLLFEQMLASKATMQQMQEALNRSRPSINAKRHRMSVRRVPGERSALSTQLENGRRLASEIRARANHREYGIHKTDDRTLARMEALAPPPGAVCIPLLALGQHQCHFPIGKGHGMFCGAATDETYCAFHRDIVYRP